MSSDLSAIKSRKWFYEFELPDGTLTQADYPADVMVIHTTRRHALRQVIARHVPDAAGKTALDISSHQGYYSIELASHFRSVTGYEYRQSTIDDARMMVSALNIHNVAFEQFDIQDTSRMHQARFDFVLVFGLLYHLENPVHALRVACRLAKQHVMIDTQIYPYDISGRIEDSHYLNLRPVNGVFALTADYSTHREGGSTDIALVPSRNALLHLLTVFGFGKIEIIEPQPDYYEQFRRGTRVMIHAMRTADAD
jgi:ubiquinone/menaquinone biosynthesis C-methylase UbiE